MLTFNAVTKYPKTVVLINLIKNSTRAEKTVS